MAMKPGDVFTQFGAFFTGLGDGLNMIDAKLDRLARQAGISLEVKEFPIEEVTDEARSVIIATRPRFEEVVWLRLNGPRDQICVRFNLTRSQVRGVLAGVTRASSVNGDSHETDTPVSPPTPASEPPPASVPDLPPLEDVPLSAPASPEEPEPAAQTPTPPSVESTPPPSESTGSLITIDTASWPARKARSESWCPVRKEYEIDATDERIFHLICLADKYKELKNRFMYTRRLSRQQVAGMKAARTRTHHAA